MEIIIMEKKELTVEEILKNNNVKDVLKLGINKVLEAFDNEGYDLITETDENNNITNVYVGKVEE